MKKKKIVYSLAIVFVLILSAMAFMQGLAGRQYADGAKLGREILNSQGDQRAVVFNCERGIFYQYNAPPVNLRVEFVADVKDGDAYISACRKRFAALCPGGKFGTISHLEMNAVVIGKRVNHSPYDDFPNTMDGIFEGYDLVFVRLEGSVLETYLDGRWVD